MAAFFGGTDPSALVRLERYRSLPVGPGLGDKMLAAVAAQHWAYSGGPADVCAALSLGALEGGQLVAADNTLLTTVAISTLALADREEADAAWRASLAEAYANGSLHSKAAASLWRGFMLYRRGELAEAEDSLRSALEELALWGAEDAEGRIHAFAFLSSVLRERGDLPGAWKVLEMAADPGDATESARYWLDAKAELLLAEERFGEALAVAEDCDRRFGFLTHLIDTPAHAHRAIALFHLQRRDEAAMLASEWLGLARDWGAPGSVARALRTLGRLEGEAGLERLQEAVDTADGSPARLELAKSLIALGAALRAARRPTDARDPLRRALELGDSLGAQPLVDQARHELHAAGGRPRTTALSGPEALTPAERRATERAAAGQTNRAIAEALFVTTKTVELHLRNAYRKLGISSRRELSEALREPPT
jgi:DNA-binding NarL/FixJ family response regulator